MKSEFWTGLTALLGMLCLTLLVVAGISAVWLGGAPRVSVGQASEQRSLRQLEALKAVRFNERPTELYSGAILQQPLFFADRNLPEIIDEEAAAQLAAEQSQQEPETQKLDARLAGIIITPEQRLAMVADNRSKKTLVLHEGMTLEGEQAAWRLDHISERMVRFAAGEEATELELKVNTKGLQAPSTSGRPQVNTNQNNAPRSAAAVANNNVSDAAAQREQTAAEIRRRIAERRAQLRAERARQAQDGNKND